MTARRIQFWTEDGINQGSASTGHWESAVETDCPDDCDCRVGGSQGPKGDKGDTGDPGADGIQGIQGVAGANGNDGIQGIQGPAGEDGTNGVDGATGPQGPSWQLPVGYIFISAVSTNPNALLGYGTWAAFGAGKVLVGLDGADTDFDVAEETGGAKTKAISTHAGTAVGTSGAGGSHVHAGPSHTHDYTQVPNHVHVMQRFPTATGGSTGFTVDTSMSGTPAAANDTANPTGGVATGTTAAGGTGNTGAESAHTHAAGSVTQPNAHSDLNVVQPYIVVYMFKRTA